MMPEEENNEALVGFRSAVTLYDVLYIQSRLSSLTNLMSKLDTKAKGHFKTIFLI